MFKSFIFFSKILKFQSTFIFQLFLSYLIFLFYNLIFKKTRELLRMRLFISSVFRCAVFYSVLSFTFLSFSVFRFLSSVQSSFTFSSVLSFFSSQIQFSDRFPAALCGRMCDVTAEVLILVQFPCKGLRACLDIVSIMKFFDYWDHYRSIIYFNLYFNIFNSKYLYIFMNH